VLPRPSRVVLRFRPVSETHRATKTLLQSLVGLCRLCRILKVFFQLDKSPVLMMFVSLLVLPARGGDYGHR